MTLNKAYAIVLASGAWLVIWGLYGGHVLLPDHRELADIVFPVAICGFVIGLLIGFAVWAGAKGYSPWLGVVLAWLGPLGMLILVFLRDKSRESAIVDSRDVWMQPEGDNSVKFISAPPTGDKTKELGVFTIGLGIIVASVLILFFLVVPTPSQSSPFRGAVAFAPSLSFVLAGIYVLFSRTTLSVDVAASIVTIGFVGQALLIPHPVVWIFSAVCLYLIWRTAGQAKQQLRSK
jgi:hypothetical protein